MRTDKFIKSIAIVALFVIYSHYIHAQAPGFMGKKITFSGGTYMGYSLGTPAKVGSTRAGLDKRFYFGADFVISRKWTTGIEYQRSVSAMKHNFGTDIEKQSLMTFTYGINANTFKFYFTQFGTESDFLAPVGRYVTFGFLLIKYTIKDPKEYLFDKEKDIYKGSTWGLSVDFGKKRVFYKCLVLDYSLQLALVIPKNVKLGKIDTVFANEATNRLMASHFLNFKLGLGWLL